MTAHKELCKRLRLVTYDPITGVDVEVPSGAQAADAIEALTAEKDNMQAVVEAARKVSDSIESGGVWTGYSAMREALAKLDKETGE